MEEEVVANYLVRQVQRSGTPLPKKSFPPFRLMSTPCPNDVARGQATRLCWGPIGKGLG